MIENKMEWHDAVNLKTQVPKGDIRQLEKMLEEFKDNMLYCAKENYGSHVTLILYENLGHAISGYEGHPGNW